MLNAALVTVAVAFAAYLALSKRLGASEEWQATVTPLASIMGSGFLVCAPLLAGTVGVLALPCMALLLALAYAVGGAIRFNIRHFEPIENDRGLAQYLAGLSRIVLAGAYFISVTYYLQLLAAFVLNGFGLESELLANVITTGLLLVIGGIGIWRGLGQLEAVEKYAVSLNLGTIAALLTALVFHNVRLLASQQWAWPAVSSAIDLHDVRVLLGLLIVVQGFETSRYLGDQHPAELRIKTMRAAQGLSTVVYLVFIGLATVLFQAGLGSDVTAITTMVRPVATVLPVLIAVAAVGSQFSAAVADNSGAGGLIEEITNRRLPVRAAYLLITLVTIALTWETNVNAIIAYASRAFALYYFLQCTVAAVVAVKSSGALRAGWYTVLALTCLLVFAVGVPSG